MDQMMFLKELSLKQLLWLTLALTHNRKGKLNGKDIVKMAEKKLCYGAGDGVGAIYI